MLMNHQRHGDVLKIATAADFCGTRWQTNAVMIPVPGGQAYLMPVARVMQLFRHRIGSHAVRVAEVPEGLDVVASRRDQKLFLHVVNTRRNRSVRVQLRMADNRPVAGGRIFQIADDPTVEVSPLNSGDVMRTVEKPWAQDGVWDIAAASVSAVELELEG